MCPDISVDCLGLCLILPILSQKKALTVYNDTRENEYFKILHSYLYATLF